MPHLEWANFLQNQSVAPLFRAKQRLRKRSRHSRPVGTQKTLHTSFLDIRNTRFRAVFRQNTSQSCTDTFVLWDMPCGCGWFDKSTIGAIITLSQVRAPSSTRYQTCRCEKIVKQGCESYWRSNVWCFPPVDFVSPGPSASTTAASSQKPVLNRNRAP